MGNKINTNDNTQKQYDNKLFLFFYTTFSPHIMLKQLILLEGILCIFLSYRTPFVLLK
jgi:hypothetical protein